MTLIETQAEAEHIAKTRALIPALRARAEETAALRRVPTENIDLLREAGSLKTIQSRRNGGFGYSMATHLEVVASMAEGCGATAWVVGVTQAHSWLLSHFPEQAQDDAYANPDNVVSAVIGPRGVAVKTADGFRLSGFWPFASGNQNSQWLLLGGVVKNEAGDVIDEGDFLIPTEAVTQIDDWFVNGLTGTGAQRRFHSSQTWLPGLLPMITDGSERKRWAGTCRSSTLTEHEPVPVRPLTNQSSIWVTASVGMRKSPSSMTSPASFLTTPPRSSHWLFWLPEAKGQKPDRRKPSAVLTATPRGPITADTTLSGLP